MKVLVWSQIIGISNVQFDIFSIFYSKLGSKLASNQIQLYPTKKLGSAKIYVGFDTTIGY